MPEHGLQDRRRFQTEREICDAALTLFEQHGVEATTVDDIARLAGVSTRTVFRYSVTKERAALLSDPELDGRLNDALAAITADTALVPQVQRAWREVLTAIEDDDSPVGSQVLRVWRLAPREPRLVLAALAQDEERLAQTHAILLERTPFDALTLSVALESTAALVRVALSRWARGDAEPAGLVATYDAAVAALDAQTDRTS